MIYLKGKQLPNRLERKEIKLRADESFCRSCSGSFGKALPEFEGRKLDLSSLILLKCKNVEPHEDPYVGNGKAPKRRAALFWLTEGNLYLQCGNQCERMTAGDYVIFDDSIMHCVVANKQWRGAAGQYI